MILLMHFLYGAKDKVTFVLYSDKLGFTQLLDLVIDLRPVVKTWIDGKSYDAIKSRILFLIAG